MFDVRWCLMLDDDDDPGDDDDTSPISSRTTGKWKMTLPQQMPVAQSWQPYPRANNGHRPCFCPAFWVEVPLGTSRADREQCHLSCVHVCLAVFIFSVHKQKNIDTNTNAELHLDTYQHLNSNNIYRSTHSNPASPKGHGVVPTPTAEGKTTGCDDSPSLGLRSSGSFIWMFPKIVVPPNHPF